MAIAIVPDPALGTSYSINTHSARNTCMTGMYLNMSDTSYVAGGVSVTLPIRDLWFVGFEPRVVTATVLFYTYDKTNTKLLVWQPVGPAATSGILLGGEIATGTSLATLTAIYCFAIGRD